jgi:hypothetical protein
MSTSQSRSSIASGVSNVELDSTDVTPIPQLPTANPKRDAGSISARSFLGRPLVRSTVKEDEDAELGYQETSGARWMERQEAHSLRMALEDMDLTEKEQEEKRIFDAAQKEAGELVWKHQNGGETTPYPNPSMAVQAGAGAQEDTAPDALVAHLKQGSHARSLSRVAREGLVMKKRGGNRSVSGSSTGSGGSSRQVSDGSVKSSNSIDQGSERASRKRSVQFAVPPAEHINEKPITIVSPLPTIDAIEEPAPKHSGVLNSMHFRNPFARARNSRSSLGSISRPSSCPPTDAARLEKVEIQKNPPTQSRKAEYTVNQPSPTTTSCGTEEELQMKDGIEIRSDDIRKATTMSLKDRSPKLPSPSMVSDSPGRPIVSFDKDWKPKEVELVQQNPVTAALKEAPKPYPTHLRHAGSRNSMPQMPFKIFEDNPQVEQSNGSRTCLDKQHISATHSRNNSDLVTASNSIPPIPTINIPDESVIPRARSYGRPLNVSNIPTVSASVTKPPIPERSPLRQPSGSTPPLPSIAFSDQAPATSSTKPPIPVIHLTDDPPVRSIPTIAIDVPSININGTSPAAPTIVINSIPSTSVLADNPTTSSRPLPKPGAQGCPFRPAPPPSQTGTNSSTRGATVLCHACAFPIAGRIVTAAGCRFHPGCFRCHHCSEALECVAFYPEPDRMFEERKDRNLRRMHGEEIEDPRPEEDGDDGIRFFCHLDFHEFFSPRCKSCKTPIEGDVVVACGAEWHAGHFFCAQCGDVSYISMLMNGPSANQPSLSMLQPRTWKRMVTLGVSTAIRIDIQPNARNAGNQSSIPL